MLRSLTTATADLFRAPVPRYCAIAAGIGIAAFVALWLGIDALVGMTFGEGGTLQTALSWLGAAATVVLAWFLFPAVASAALGLFLEPLAAAIERRHWPELPPAPGLPFLASLGACLRFLGVLLAANTALVLVLVVVPPMYPMLWLLGNGWLLGREYFELVALRRLRPADARALRAAHAGELFGHGILFAGLFAVPVVNLLVPVWATAVMVHRLARWRDLPRS